MRLCALLALATSPILAAAAPDWENPAVFQRNKLPARASTVPFPDRASALAKARLESPWCQSLNGNWKFHYSGNLEGVPAGFEKPSFDVGAWKEIPVPSNWQLQGYGIPIYSGTTYPFANHPPAVTDEPPVNYTNHAPENRHPIGSYRRTFTLPADWSARRTILAFEGVDSAFDLWINGEKAGYSEDSRTTAQFDITSLVKPGENTVAVQVHQYSDGSYLESQDTWKLSGIYRDVYVTSSPQIALADHQLIAGLTESNGKGTLDFSGSLENHDANSRKGKLSIEILSPDGGVLTKQESTYDIAAGTEAVVKLSATDLAVQPWSAEQPSLYAYVLTVSDDAGNVLACHSGKTGFRRDEIKDGRFLHNGQPIVLKGVVRSDHSVRTGHAVTEADLRAELLMMKRANINAVRTGHAPAQPAFLDLCDELGLYVVDEPNLDTRGSKPEDKLSSSPDWKEARLDRVKNVTARDRNHPSVIAWSVPDEDLLPWLHEHSASRPDNSSKVPALQEGSGRVAGNSSLPDWNGTSGYQGGFIASWKDELLIQKSESSGISQPSPRVKLSYGGDFGDQPNAGSGCVDGIVTTLQGSTPAFEELKKILQEVRTTLVDGTTPAVKIKVGNERFFTGLGDVKGSWKLLKDGKNLAQGDLPPLIAGPGGTQELTLPTNVTPESTGEYILRFRYDLEKASDWYPAGMPVAWDEILLPWGKRSPAAPLPSSQAATFTQDGNYIRATAGQISASIDRTNGQLVSLKRGADEILLAPLHLDFWRVPTQTDKAHGLDRKAAVWREAGSKASARKVEVAQNGNDVIVTAGMDIPAGKSTATVIWKFTGGGEIAADVSFQPDASQPDIPRIGFTCAVPLSLTNWTWYGKGPHDNYVDRNQGTWSTIHTGLLPVLIHRYPIPQESGNRTEVRWARFESPVGGTGLRIDATGDSLLEVSAMIGNPADHEAIGHVGDLPRPDRLSLHLDHRQSALGNPDAVDTAHRLSAAQSYHWSFLLGTAYTTSPANTGQRATPPGLPVPPDAPSPGEAGRIPPVPPHPPGTPAPPAKPNPASDD